MSGSFSLFFFGHVKYNGRALGLLGPGRFLLLRKNDGSVSVHGGLFIPPRNYMGEGAKMEGEIGHNKTVVFKRKNETITINITECLNFVPYDNWSEDEVHLRRTEKELVNKLFWNWPDYFDIECFSIEMEVLTEYGPIDLLGTEFDGTKNVIEVKRRKVSVSDCTQLRKYVETFNGLARGYLAGPDIGDKALDYLEKLGYTWIRVEFDV